MLEAHIIKRRRDFTVNVSLACDSGDALGLFGPSGAGKSTVLTCIAGLETPDQGHVRLDGASWFPPLLPLHRRSVGYLAQEPGLFPHLNVAANVSFGLPRAAGNGTRAWLQELQRQFGLAAIWNAPVTHISAGQAQRVALARMLARRPRLVMLDEPFSGLDRALVRGLLADLLQWRARLGFTLLAVDHQAEVLERLCPRVLTIEAGEVTSQGAWSELRRDAAPTLAGLFSPL